MAQKKDKDLEAVHETAIQRMNKVQSNSYDERKQSLEDRRFASIAGAQWEDELGQFFENKPKLEINKIAMPLLKLKAEYRKNRLTVDFVSKDGSDSDVITLSLKQVPVVLVLGDLETIMKMNTMKRMNINASL